MQLSYEEFEQLVVNALDQLPEQILQHLENVDVVLDDWPSNEQLAENEIEDGDTMLGLYEGIPHIERVSSYGLVPPDIITIFQGPVELEANETDGDVSRVVRETVIHEIAHHFGISDERLIELDRY